MTPPLLTALASRFSGATWLSVEPKQVRQEVWYFVQWEDRLGRGQLLVSEREFEAMVQPICSSSARDPSSLALLP